MPGHMKDAVPIWTGTSAVALMIAYYSIPFLILDGASASLGKLRPPLLLGSLAVALFGFFQLWRIQRSSAPPSGLSVAALLVSSVVVLGMMLFSQPIASFLANSFGG